MGIGNTGECCEETEVIRYTNEKLGTSFDTIQAVFDKLDDITKVAALGTLNQGLKGDKGDAPTITTLSPSSYSITGFNTAVTISDGFSPTVEPTPTGVAITDKAGVITNLNNGLSKYVTYAYRNAVNAPTLPTNGSYDGNTLVPPTGFTNTISNRDVGETTWVVQVTYSEQADGTWLRGTWSNPTGISGDAGTTPVKGVDYFDGKSGIYTSYIFRVAPTAPATPTGGSFTGDSNTEVEPTGWLDNPPTPTGTDKVWVSVRRYQYNGSVWTGNTWSSPTRMTGDTGPQGAAPVKGVDYFDGLTGDYNSYVFTNSATVPTITATGSFNGLSETPPTGWTLAPETPASDEYTWISHTTYRNTVGNTWVRNTWSVPARHSGYTPQEGVDYTDGVDGSFKSYIHRTSTTQPTTPTGGSYDGTSETTPTSWSDSPTAPSAGNYVWISSRLYRKSGNSWVAGAWSTPRKISGDNGYTPVKGVDYFDGLAGRFTSYIFRMATSAPTLPVGGSYNGTTEVIPTAWFDDPQIPTGNNRIYVSKAIYTANAAGIWSHSGWSTPVRFDGVDGLNGNDGADGAPGVRGSKRYYTNGTSWSNATADLAITNAGDIKIQWDVVTISGGTFSQTRYWTGTGWAILTEVIDGNLLVTGTIRGDAISAATTILAGSGTTQAGMNGSNTGIYDGWRFWAGGSTPATAPFRIAANGDLYAENGVFNGTVQAENINGNITDALLFTGYSNAAITDATGGEKIIGVQLNSEPFDRYVKIDTFNVFTSGTQLGLTFTYGANTTSSTTNSGVFNTPSMAVFVPANTSGIAELRMRKINTAGDAWITNSNIFAQVFTASRTITFV